RGGGGAQKRRVGPRLRHGEAVVRSGPSIRGSWLGANGGDPREFLPEFVKVRQLPPSPLPRTVLYALLALFAAALAWTCLGRLDIVAVAQGKLVPQSFVKIVQPAESGIVREILVKEGDTVKEGQVLLRMDSRYSEVDGRT